jgi:hypothetical protein
MRLAASEVSREDRIMKITTMGLNSQLGRLNLKLLELKRLYFIIAWPSFFLFLVFSASAQGVYSHWINKTGGSVPESSIGAAMDTGTNVYVLGRFYDYTNRIGTATLTNQIAVSNLFLAKFTGNSVAAPPWVKTAVTEYPISHVKLVANSGGDCIVAGSFGGTNLNFGGKLTNLGTSGDNSEDVFIAKFNTGGTFGWLIQAGGTSNDVFGDMSVDQAFSNPTGFYVTGSFESTNFTTGGTTLTRISTNGMDCFVAKYNFSGTLLWIKQAAYAAGTLVANDTSNNCYVAGATIGPATFDGLSPSNQMAGSFLAKYDKTPNLVWVRGDVPAGNRLSVDKFQNIYTAGTFSNMIQIGSITLSNNSPSTIYLAKCDTNGTPLWALQLPGWGFDSLNGMAIDSAGNCWIAGNFATTNQTVLPTNSVAVVACFDPSGNVVAVSPMSGVKASMASVVGGTGNNFNGNMFFSGSYTTNLLVSGKYGVTNSGLSDIYASVGGVSPPLKLAMSSTNVVCSWPSVNATFTLQVLTNLSSGGWSTFGSGTSVNGQMVSTNSLTSNARFFRLINNNP